MALKIFPFQNYPQFFFPRKITKKRFVLVLLERNSNENLIIYFSFPIQFLSVVTAKDYNKFFMLSDYLCSGSKKITKPDPIRVSFLQMRKFLCLCSPI